ncbi:MAG: TatD family hydrolase [Anaeromyxobacteraceae bacterium]|nr:TatD family hydrolase [Anaeromyxobacteraceae bacterium]
MELLDSHAHLDFEDYRDDLDAVVARAAAAGVRRIVAIGLWKAPGSFGNALALAAARPETFAATIGVHPHDCARVPEADWLESERLAHDPRVVGVGETGLDFHYDLSPREAQEAAFRRSLRIARGAGKPVVIHLREADGAAERILREEGLPQAGGVVHCFTGDAASARTWLSLGLHVSVAGIATFRTAGAIREAIALVPRDRLLVETDSPFLAPVPLRGKRNEPANVVHVAAKVAEVWGIGLEEVAALTTANARRLFRLGGGATAPAAS